MSEISPYHRRQFLKSGGALAAALPVASFANAGGSGELKVALIGCGGRGRGAATQTLNVPGTRLVAVADAFRDNAERAVNGLRERFKDRVDVPKERIFDGFDGYRHAIEAADVVLLTTSPGFRPYHFEYAVEKDKHVFMEKPVAVDAPGVRKVLDAAAKADKKNLKVVCGLQRRFQNVYRETLSQVRNNAIGEIVGGQIYWNGGGVWVRERVEGMTEMQYQMRNWYYFNWLCGDHIVEQHVHNIDIMNWFKDGHPVKAQGMGGRQVRVGPEFGEIYDHHFVEFTYADGTMMNSQCRHQPGTMSRRTEIICGQNGRAYPGRIVNRKGETVWRFRGKKNDPYQDEHTLLYEHIRSGKPINNAYYTAESTMTAIMGRMATYSGQELTWEQALNSKISIMPKNIENLDWSMDPGPKAGTNGLYPCPVPGQHKVI